MSRDDCSPVERALKVLYPTDICTPTRHSPTDICIHLCCCLQESMRLFKQCDADRPFACSCTCIIMYHTLCRHSMKFHIVLSWLCFFPLSLICTFSFWGRTILLGILANWPTRISTWHVKKAACWTSFWNRNDKLSRNGKLTWNEGEIRRFISQVPPLTH